MKKIDKRKVRKFIFRNYDDVQALIYQAYT